MNMKLLNRCDHDWAHIVKNEKIDVFDDFSTRYPAYAKIVNIWICQKCGKSKEKIIKY